MRIDVCWGTRSRLNRMTQTAATTAAMTTGSRLAIFEFWEFEFWTHLWDGIFHGVYLSKLRKQAVFFSKKGKRTLILSGIMRVALQLTAYIFHRLPIFWLESKTKVADFDLSAVILRRWYWCFEHLINLLFLKCPLFQPDLKMMMSWREIYDGLWQ